MSDVALQHKYLGQKGKRNEKNLEISLLFF